MPVELVCCKFCDMDIPHLFGFNSDCQSYSGISGLLVVSLLSKKQEQQFHEFSYGSLSVTRCYRPYAEMASL